MYLYLFINFIVSILSVSEGMLSKSSRDKTAQVRRSSVGFKNKLWDQKPAIGIEAGVWQAHLLLAQIC